MYSYDRASAVAARPKSVRTAAPSVMNLRMPALLQNKLLPKIACEERSGDRRRYAILGARAPTRCLMPAAPRPNRTGLWGRIPKTLCIDGSVRIEQFGFEEI